MTEADVGGKVVEKNRLTKAYIKKDAQSSRCDGLLSIE